MNYSTTYKLLAVNIFIVSTIFVAFCFGYVAPFFNNDVTHLTYLLLFLMIVNIGLRIWDSYKSENLYSYSGVKTKKYLEYSTSQLFYIGILGTVLGFGHIMLAVQNLSDTAKLLHEMIQGSLTLFNTTALGIIAYLWSRLNSFIVEGE